jgi:protein O-mannosyl-transferase
MRLKKNIQSGKGLPSGLPTHRAFRWQTVGVCIFLVVVTFAIYGQTLRYEFVNYDDEKYVYENPIVSAGLTLKGIAWAFSSYHFANWVPLTLISHMLDCQLYQLDPGGHHLTNVLLHTASAIILLLVLRRMTGAFWPSAFVAAVFAFHPLHVESVAWVSERKDVLSGLFFMLTLWAYCRYFLKPSIPRYLLVVLFFMLGLMSKPMLVTLPLILLLLDFWPLNRFTKAQTPAVDSRPLPWLEKISIPARLVVEKIPLLLISAASLLFSSKPARFSLSNTFLFPGAWATPWFPVSSTCIKLFVPQI